MKKKWIITLVTNKKYESEYLRTTDGCLMLYTETQQKFNKVEKKSFFRTQTIPMVKTNRVYTHVFPLSQVKSAILEEGME